MFLFDMNAGSLVGIIIACIVAGLLIGFFVSRALFKRQLKKNPPINEKMIRTMMQQMGRTPSEKQVRAIMKSVNEQQN